MKAGTCDHTRARFHAVQKLGKLPSVVLYNCPDCRTTISEQTLEKIRAGQPAKLEPVLTV